MLQKQCVIGVEKKIFETMKRIGGFDREREREMMRGEGKNFFPRKVEELRRKRSDLSEEF